MEVVEGKGELVSAEEELGNGGIADVGTQADEVGVVYEQYMDYFSGKGAGVGRNFAGDRESRDLMEGNLKPVRVSFEGNIGVGKSTILKLLQSHPRLQEITEILQEPIWEWQNVKGTGLNMLDAFYKDPKRYAYLFQSFVFTTRFLQQNKAASESKADLLLMERSVLTDRCVFVKTSTEQGYFNPLEAAAYDVWYDGVVSTLPNVVPDAFVYLRADPNVCYDRLKARARSEEAGVSLEYLRSLHSKHENWFIENAFKNAGNGNWGGKPQVGYFGTSSKIPAVIQGRPVFVVDCTNTLDFGRPSKEVDRVVEEIVSFLLGPYTSLHQA
ncbi:hypothetical protein M758_7G078500 [Ceratodon purpureus]|nr:hypothetical protein M758_7G078500 [Ceratodon purpureus]KAG0610615.1 hypothetical protein M758_7G078500 [Ceratodon purpureus]